MKKISVLSLIILTVSFSACAETELEKLWEKAKLNNPDIHSAEYTLEYAQSSLKYKRSLYPFSLNSSVSSGFNDIYENVIWYPNSSKASVSVSKKNPFGNSVTAGVSYSMDRGIIDYSAEEIDSDSIGYSKTPAVNLSVNQSLLPGIAYGVKDPNSEILRRNVRTAVYSKDGVEKNLIESLTDYYIQIRCLNRLLEKYKKYIEFYELKIDASNELVKKSKLSISDVWTLENKKWEYYKDFLETLNSKESIDIKLANLCGETVEEIFSDSELPDIENELFSYSISKEKILNDIEILKLQNVITRQDSAPSISVGASFSELTATDDSLGIDFIEDKTLLNWDFSLGISFSEFFSPSRKLRKQLFKNNLRIYEEKLDTVNKETANKQTEYKKIISSYESQLEKALEMHKNRIRLMNDYTELFSAGKCSKQEMEEVRLNATESECIYKNLEDNLWLYRWKKVQCK